jgi:hypothetical protein
MPLFRVAESSLQLRNLLASEVLIVGVPMRSPTWGQPLWGWFFLYFHWLHISNPSLAIVHFIQSVVLNIPIGWPNPVAFQIFGLQAEVPIGLFSLCPRFGVDELVKKKPITLWNDHSTAATIKRAHSEGILSLPGYQDWEIKWQQNTSLRGIRWTSQHPMPTLPL